MHWTSIVLKFHNWWTIHHSYIIQLQFTIQLYTVTWLFHFAHLPIILIPCQPGAVLVVAVSFNCIKNTSELHIEVLSSYYWLWNSNMPVYWLGECKYWDSEPLLLIVLLIEAEERSTPSLPPILQTNSMAHILIQNPLPSVSCTRWPT